MPTSMWMIISIHSSLVSYCYKVTPHNNGKICNGDIDIYIWWNKLLHFKSKWLCFMMHYLFSVSSGISSTEHAMQSSSSTVWTSSAGSYYMDVVSAHISKWTWTYERQTFRPGIVLFSIIIIHGISGAGNINSMSHVVGHDFLPLMFWIPDYNLFYNGNYWAGD